MEMEMEKEMGNCADEGMSWPKAEEMRAVVQEEDDGSVKEDAVVLCDG